jgi:hypothetical protein
VIDRLVQVNNKKGCFTVLHVLGFAKKNNKVHVTFVWINPIYPAQLFSISSFFPHQISVVHVDMRTSILFFPLKKRGQHEILNEIVTAPLYGKKMALWLLHRNLIDSIVH